jgi:hypothetical protein
MSLEKRAWDVDSGGSSVTNIKERTHFIGD